MRRFFWLSPFVVIAFLGALPSLAKEPAKPTYLVSEQIELLKLLPPAPAPDSDTQKRDMQTVLDIQSHRTPAQVKRVQDDAKVSVFRFADVLSANFIEKKLPKCAAFFEKVINSEPPFYRPVKNYWQRPRPFVASAEVSPAPGLKEPEYDAKTKTYSFSFPSGHATFGATFAILLTQMVPEKRTELFARGWEFGQNRVMAGMHYPSDVEVGRIEATVLVYAMMQNPQFQKDFADAKAELRAVLGLAP